MDTILEIRTWLLVIIPVGVAARIILCLIYTAFNSDEASSYKKKIVHALIFLAVAESIVGLSDTIINYFPGGITWPN